MHNKLPLLLLLFFASHGLHAQTADAAIRAARAESNRAIARHSLEGIVRDMLPDYSIVMGRGQHVEGREKMSAFWQKTFETTPNVTYVRTATSIVISRNDSLAWETGRWTAEHSYSAGGNYSAMWRSMGNSWKLAAELFVSLEK